MAAVKVLFSALSTRWYSRSFLRKCFKSFGEVKPIQVSSLLPVITTYSRSSMNLIRHLKNNFHSTLKDLPLLQDYRPIAALRRGKNLCDLLVRATVPLLGRCDRGFYNHCAWVKNWVTGNVYRTQLGTSITPKNCVHLITCDICGFQYVDETGNSIRTRFYAHKHIIIKNQDVSCSNYTALHRARVASCSGHYLKGQPTLVHSPT